MSRLYLRFYAAMLAGIAVYTVVAMALRHHIGGLPFYAWYFVFTALALLFSIAAYPVARRLTRRLERLQQAVDALGAGELQARIEVEGRDEVAQLAHSFNQTAERIEALVQAQKSLLSNASHELRTPLTRLKLTVTLMKDAAAPAHKAALDQDIAELDDLIDEILLASRLDACKKQNCQNQAPFEAIDLLALAAEECARYDDDDNEVQLDGVSVSIHGDARLLRRLLRNLLENARRHGAAPTTVEIIATKNGAELRVADRGPGIDPAHSERIFEPFFRGHKAQENTGTGLGLSLVRQIARHHGGDAVCECTEDGHSRFVIRLAANTDERKFM